jgi:hypothetical protein
MDGGDWLLAVAAATDLGGTTFEPRDIVRFDGLTYTRFWSGAAAGVPAGSRIDALFLNGGDEGDLVLSFDAVTAIGATTFAPADLAQYASSAWSKYFDATLAGIAPTSNVTGADVHAGRTLLTFDVPTTVAGVTYLPGEVVSWDGSALALYHHDPSWPIGSRIDGVASLAHPGVVMESLRVARSAVVPGGLTLSWSRSCSAGAEDYAIYEGRIGAWYSHQPLDCSDDGADRTEDVMPSSGDRYYLVVPTNHEDEGSYGTASNGNERPRGTALCAANQELAACP